MPRASVPAPLDAKAEADEDRRSADDHRASNKNMSQPPLAHAELAQVFRDAEKKPSEFLIGAESEKFGVHCQTGAPLSYGGDFSVCRIFSALEKEHGWEPMRESEGAAVLGLRRGGASITLEPSVQFELSGAALPDLHLVREEADQHLREIASVSEAMHLAWLTTGFHPLAKLSELSWVPKRRYPIMREYLPQKGSGGLDMMQRTATTQGNFDWQTEDDAMSKLMLALKLSPLLHAWFANAPFKEGAVSDSLSVRGHVWLNMDPARSGLIRSLWDMERPRYENYVQWALDAGMFLFFRDGQLVKNTGQTFRDFLENGFSGHRANLEDWKLHLNTLFPEVRLKNTLEVRSVDALPPYLALASLAVWTGVLYDSRALEEATALTSEWTYDELQSQRVSLCDRGLHTEFCGRTGFEWAEQVCEIAEAGLVRRGRGNGSYRDESIHLAPAAAILETRQHPADRARQAVRDGHSIIAATAVAMRRST